MTTPHGPLRPLLLVLTVVTGVVDAVSILELGRVFVANMTGNVVFIGFALAGAPGFSLAASLSALAGFLVAAALYGVLARRIGRAAGSTLLHPVEANELFLRLGAAGKEHRDREIGQRQNDADGVGRAERRLELRQDDPPEALPGRGAEIACGLFDPGV